MEGVEAHVNKCGVDVDEVFVAFFLFEFAFNRRLPHIICKFFEGVANSTVTHSGIKLF